MNGSAASSLPVPLSPSSRTVVSRAATRARRANTALAANFAISRPKRLSGKAGTPRLADHPEGYLRVPHTMLTLPMAVKLRVREFQRAMFRAGSQIADTNPSPPQRLRNGRDTTRPRWSNRPARCAPRVTRFSGPRPAHPRPDPRPAPTRNVAPGTRASYAQKWPSWLQCFAVPPYAHRTPLDHRMSIRAPMTDRRGMKQGAGLGFLSKSVQRARSGHDESEIFVSKHRRPGGSETKSALLRGRSSTLDAFRKEPRTCALLHPASCRHRRADRHSGGSREFRCAKWGRRSTGNQDGHFERYESPRCGGDVSGAPGAAVRSSGRAGPAEIA